VLKVGKIEFQGGFMHGLDTEEGRRTSFPPLRYGCQLQPKNQNKQG
jgi:hypothetical protein